MYSHGTGDSIKLFKSIPYLNNASTRLLTYIHGGPNKRFFMVPYLKVEWVPARLKYYSHWRLCVYVHRQRRPKSQLSSHIIIADCCVLIRRGSHCAKSGTFDWAICHGAW